MIMIKPLEWNWLLRPAAERPKRDDIGLPNEEPLPLAPAQRIVVLKEYEEVVGPLCSFEERNGTLLAEIGKIVVALPIGLKDILSPNLNRRIAILRTDIPGKKYLFRVLPDERPDYDVESAASDVQAAATETNSHQHKLERVL
jgi:hypothetical protein